MISKELELYLIETVKYNKSKISKSFHLKPVVSYTTRPKRDNETEGVEHYFIDSETAKKKLESENVLAYTKIGEFEYFATLEALNDSNLYIIDPKGIKYIKDKFGDKIPTKVIYIYTRDDVRIERCKRRSDFDVAFKKRCESEDEQFAEFEYNMDWDCVIINDYLINAIQKTFRFIYNTIKEQDNTLFLIAGRTGSGKDTICKILSEGLNED